MDEFTKQYLITALWSTNDESTPQGGEPFDKHFSASDRAPETLAKMQADCKKFQEENAEDIQADLSQAGHDFWLTRDFHGSGFWDGDWPEPAATRLTDASHKFGEFNLYLGDDKKIHH